MKQFQLGISECNVKKSGKSQSENQMTKYQKPISLARGFAMTTTRWTSDSGMLRYQPNYLDPEIYF